jgi:predicted GTPase
MLDFIGISHKYILTSDNFLKMILIIIRSRFHVPIVIMGETGCGKISLVKFLYTEVMQEGFETINFHAGINGACY